MKEALVRVGLFHDMGKACQAFQNRLRGSGGVGRPLPENNDLQGRAGKFPARSHIQVKRGTNFDTQGGCGLSP